ncbi:FtsZ-interacting protein [Streptococcus sp. DD10]|uniref:cell division protein SepF n=1 Tax=Streptococcus sp. DD10 TaxID=1777878 RepID=UPI000799922F|nr:cell division protein SepF [Streptococcus sp. DD10]KXT73748.1 FtsZ-interacting protein [Streptococcus sp. DD10]
MSLRDRFDTIISYFTEDDDAVEVEKVNETAQENELPSAVGEVTPKQVSSTTPNPIVSSETARKASRPVVETKQTVVKTQRHQMSARVSTESQGTEKNITRLHARQQELAQAQGRQTDSEKVIIDVRYPRKYEEATEIVDSLIANESILIDFQYMTEVQARRCLDYLDGARYVLAGNLRKVANTMYLLTPINVIVNIEDIRLPDDTPISEYDFDMKRR